MEFSQRDSFGKMSKRSLAIMIKKIKKASKKVMGS